MGVIIPPRFAYEGVRREGSSGRNAPPKGTTVKYKVHVVDIVEGPPPEPEPKKEAKKEEKKKPKEPEPQATSSDLPPLMSSKLSAFLAVLFIVGVCAGAVYLVMKFTEEGNVEKTTKKSRKKRGEAAKHD